MSYLITGATGFIGAHIIRELLRSGEKGVVAYDLNPVGNSLDGVLNEEEKSKIKLIKGDILDLAQLLRTIKENNVMHVIHLAAFLPPACIANPKLAVRVNCEGTANVFEAARILNLTKVTWASTASIFGAQSFYPEGDIPNDATHTPLMLYASCKSLNEQLAATYFEHYGVDSSGLRPTVGFGLGKREGLGTRIVHELMVKPVLGEPSEIPFGDSNINWLYVDDAAHAFIEASKVTRAPTRVYNLSGDVRTVAEAAEYAKEISPGAKITLLKEGELPLATNFDASVIEKEVGFKCKWTLKDAMLDIAEKVHLQYSIKAKNA